MNGRNDRAHPGNPIAFTRQFVDNKMRRQAGVPTFYDNHLRGLVAASQGLSPEAPGEESAGDADRAYKELTGFAGLAALPRFQDPLPRLSRDLNDVLAQMAVSLAAYEAGQGVLTAIYWAGRPLFKTIYDLAAYPMLIAELKPKAIIELGSGSGASAVWLADVAGAHGLNPQIISIDQRCAGAADSRVTFLNGDIADLKTLLDPYISSLQRPWLVIEDAHVHIAEVLRYFDEHLCSGDYMIVEDSTPKRGELYQFASAAPGRYWLDTLYLDLFGQNTTCAIDSIFRRM
jgi:cephalosporin hydroxylase